MPRKLKKTERITPFVIGLTGSIGMGKSTIAALCKKTGAAVCDSDRIVHALLGPGGGAVKIVTKAFPQTFSGQGIDRKALAKEVFSAPEKLKKLESILHPLVQKAQNLFIKKMQRLGKKYVVLDIPLLFETGAERRCHAVLVVNAPAFIQRQRVFKRPGMTEEKFTRILARQMPTQEKKRRADFIIHTGLGKALSYKQVRQMLKKCFSSRVKQGTITR